MKFNERKLQVLGLFEIYKSMALRDVVNITGEDDRLMATLLKHYYDLGYLKRRGKYIHIYSLTKKGKRILEKLRKKKEENKPLKIQRKYF